MSAFICALTASRGLTRDSETAWGRELDNPEMALFPAAKVGVPRPRKNAVCMFWRSVAAKNCGGSGCLAMVHHYSKEVSKFRLARSAMKMLESEIAAVMSAAGKILAAPHHLSLITVMHNAKKQPGLTLPH